MAGKTTKRPKTITIGSRVKVRVIRGPKPGGLWYWRAEAYDAPSQARTTIWTGWGTREDAEHTVTRLSADTPDIGRRRIDYSTVKTVRDLLEVWSAAQDERRDLAPNTRRIYLTCARHLVGGTIADVRIDRLSVVHLEQYRDARMKSGSAGSTVRVEFEALSFAWRWWSDVGPVPLRPFPKVRLKETPVRNRRTPPREDVLRVLEVLDGWGRIAVLLLFATGARPGEIRDLRWRDVDLNRGELHLRGKTGERWVPIAPGVARELHRWKGQQEGTEEDRLITAAVSTFDSFFGPHLLKRACEQARVQRFTPYGLRRAAVDAMARAGVDIATAAAITGHSPTVMLKHYRTVNDDDRRQAVLSAGLGVVPEGRVLPLRAVDEGES